MPYPYEQIIRHTYNPGQHVCQSCHYSLINFPCHHEWCECACRATTSVPKSEEVPEPAEIIAVADWGEDGEELVWTGVSNEWKEPPPQVSNPGESEGQPPLLHDPRTTPGPKEYTEHEEAHTERMSLIDKIKRWFW